MKQKKKIDYKRKAIRLLIAAGVLAAILVLLLILRSVQSISEWMASVVSRRWIEAASRIFGLIPFSVYELFLYVAIISLITLVVLAIICFCRKSGARGVSFLLTVVIIGLSFGNVYTLSAGFSYYRAEVDVPAYERAFFTEDDKDYVIRLAEEFFADFNEVARTVERDEDGRTVLPYTISELSGLFAEEYKRLNSDYFLDYTPKAKAIVSKNIMSHMHITGVFFAPFGEANINPLTPACSMPVTVAHELAHAKGVMREDEANLVAYWVTVTSDNPYLRYSGYRACYSYMFNIVSYFDSDKANELYASIDECIKKEWTLSAEFWSQYTLLHDITDWFNDLYLKLQGQKEGTGSYNESVIPPGEVEVPSGGEEGGGAGGGTQTVQAFFLNNVQRMLVQAISERLGD
ncbi:MAG: DUF3810 domain-containing protein [Clostridiales bacterium]|nr:DUF3810 domain-containing protein [Clostridiales bacterium]